MASSIKVGLRKVNKKDKNNINIAHDTEQAITQKETRDKIR